MQTFFVLLLALSLFAGCSDDVSNTGDGADSENEGQGEKEEEAVSDDITEPATIRIGIAMDEEGFTKNYKEPVEEHFPNVTLELIPMNQTVIKSRSN